MIIPKAGKLTDAQMIEIEHIVSEFKCSILEIEGHNVFMQFLETKHIH